MKLKEEHKIILFSFILGVLIWLSDAIIDSAFFHEESFMELAFYEVSAFEVYFRTTIFAVIVISGILVSSYIKRTRKAEASGIQSLAEFEQIFDAGVPMCVIGKDKRLIKANETFQEFFGMAEKALLDKKCFEIIPCEECQTQNCRVLRIEQSQTNLPDEETVISTPDGRKIPSIVRATPYYDANKQFIGIVESFIDISSRKKAEEKAAELMVRMSLKNEELENFAQTIAHDLKTPLTMISNAVSLIEKTHGEMTEKEAGYMDWIKSGASKMNFMISGLLDYCVLGHESVEYHTFTLGEVLDEVKFSLRQQLLDRGVTLAVQNGGQEVYADKMRVGQILENLIGNSIKYMGKLNSKPFIEVGADDENGEAVIYVKDNGIGIKKENFAKVFSVFHRIKDLEDVDGTGVGLAIVKRIVENHGGRIWVESEYGRGASFYFTLKKGAPQKEETWLKRSSL